MEHRHNNKKTLIALNNQDSTHNTLSPILQVHTIHIQARLNKTNYKVFFRIAENPEN